MQSEEKKSRSNSVEGNIHIATALFGYKIILSNFCIPSIVIFMSFHKANSSEVN